MHDTWLTSLFPLIAIISCASIAAILGSLLGYINTQLKSDDNNLVDQIDALLPQTQCGQCGHPGCRPYAMAIAEGEAINRCPPGGQPTIDALANLLNVINLPLDTSHGTTPEIPMVAFIREAECIGCVKCIEACPVDAILGAAQHMHTVIADECTGCDLCVAPCPVDCIEMVPAQAELI